MTEWVEKKISELGKVVGGATPSTKDESNYLNGTIAWITPKDLADLKGRYISHGERNITEKGLRGCSVQLMPKHSILFSSRAPIGYIAISNNAVCTNQGFKSIVPNSNTDYMFLYYLLKYNKDKIEAMGSGTTFKEVSGTTMKNIVLRVPSSLNVQKRIASILSSIDDKIEENNVINHNLQQQAFALFDSLFTNVSEGSRTIGDYITPKRGRNLLSKNAIPGIVPVVAGGLEPATYHNTANTTAPVLTISASGANAGFVNLWHKPVWSSDSSFIDSSMTKDVYFWFVMLKKRQREIFDAQTGSAQPHIYPQHIAAMPVCALDESVISLFSSQVAPLFTLIGANIDENERLSAIRDTLLPQLMCGEIDVSDVEI